MNRLCDNRKLCWQEWVLVVMSAIMITMCLAGVRIVYVIGSSMAPTLSDNSIHLTVPVANPQVGDIVAFSLPDDGRTNYIKRVVAGPGDVVIGSNEMMILGDNEYYVLGDNFGNSDDSRNFGPIDKSDIKGKLLF